MAGIYIHIPFCKQACTYCNFHFSTSLKQKEQFLHALKKEILLTPLLDQHSGESIETIYIGGGTPSLLDVDDLKKIFESLHQKFNVNKDAEITLEANPDDINETVLYQWQRMGVNRLSLGVQSFSEDELRWMNRAHHATDSIRSIDIIRQTGFSNFSVDLIYGSPLLTNDGLKKNLEIIFEKNIPHLSCYALTVEPKTLLENMINRKNALPTDPEKQADQFLMLMDFMEQEGYEHYEISNYAKPGMHSKHNSSYWEGKSYYGFGPSAHSFNGRNSRRWNVANNALYIQSLLKDTIPFEEEVLNQTQQLNEYIMTSLRTTEGLSMKRIEKLFGNGYTQQLLDASKKYIDNGKLILQNESLFLSREGKLFADGIASDLFV